MDISGPLARDLRILTAALGRPDVDLACSVSELTDSMRRAVPSWLGFTMTLVRDGPPLVLTVLDDGVPAGPVAGSARLPLALAGTAGQSGSIVFYAGTPGAFVDFAADLGFALGLEPAAVVLDRHRTPPGRTSDLTGPAAGLDQAIGVLIDQGRTPEEARAELGDQARNLRISLDAAARQLDRPTAPTPPDVPPERFVASITVLWTMAMRWRRCMPSSLPRPARRRCQAGSSDVTAPILAIRQRHCPP
ncbi:hypothetical protein [Kitasatospora sp. NPDC002040]|uniref:hypothetical protein n=1 Tax=Kitasatospora sp. NPDC002040 TaxID=3154661 RepID=UPI00331E4E23